MVYSIFLCCSLLKGLFYRWLPEGVLHKLDINGSQGKRGAGESFDDVWSEAYPGVDFDALSSSPPSSPEGSSAPDHRPILLLVDEAQCAFSEALSSGTCSKAARVRKSATSVFCWFRRLEATWLGR